MPLIPPPPSALYPAHDPALAAFHRMRLMMDQLRENCPWDRNQDFDSLRTLTVEEVYELIDAIELKDWTQVAGELGDLFLHLLFYSRLGKEQGCFELAELLDTMCEKLIRRHPHLYAEVQAESPEQVKANWEKIKLSEGRTSILQGVPRSLPAMVKAMRIQEKAAGAGFDWKRSEDVMSKIKEELMELSAAREARHRAEEWGDLMFSMINWARFEGINPENVLEAANRKFITRFKAVEKEASDAGLSVTDLSMEQMQAAWDRSKLTE
jgi:XTP/dITP diphosphohydrolase